MKLKVGKKAFPIEFDAGDKAIIYFNPNDPELAVRLKRFKKQAEERAKEIKGVTLSDDGIPTEDKSAEVIEAFGQMIDIVKDELDRAVGADISKEVFRHCSPFAMIDGEYFLIQFLEAITPEIQKATQQARKVSEKKMGKYLAEVE